MSLTNLLPINYQSNWNLENNVRLVAIEDWSGEPGEKLFAGARTRTDNKLKRNNQAFSSPKSKDKVFLDSESLSVKLQVRCSP